MQDNENETVASAKKYILRILSGPHMGAEVTLAQDKKFVLGKGEDCDIVLKDDRLADQHALFSFQEDVMQSSCAICLFLSCHICLLHLISHLLFHRFPFWLYPLPMLRIYCSNQNSIQLN